MLISFCAVHPQKDNTRGRRGWRHTTVIFALTYRNQLELMGLPFVPEHDNAGTWTTLLHKRYLAYKYLKIIIIINLYYIAFPIPTYLTDLTDLIRYN